MVLADECKHVNKYLIKTNFYYIEDVEGHYVTTYSTWACPDCDSVISEVTARTYQGHAWSLVIHDHVSGKFHTAWYVCHPCGREKVVEFICDGPPCDVQIYRLIREEELY